MSTRVQDLGTAYLQSVRPLLPDPANPPAATVAWATATASAALAPELLLPVVPPLLGPIVAPLTVGAVQPVVPDVVPGQFFLNPVSGSLYVYTGPANGWRQIQFV